MWFLELKEDKSTAYVLSWKSKWVYSFKLKPFYTGFLHSIKLSGYRKGIKFDKDPLAVEQNICVSKIVNAYIVYDLDAWSRYPFNNFKLKSCLFGSTNIVKNIDIEKWLYSGWGIAFDRAGLWNLGNDFARNVVIFGVDNSS